MIQNFFAGDSITIHSLMDEIVIQTKMPADSTGKRLGYIFAHTNQINFLTQKNIFAENTAAGWFIYLNAYIEKIWLHKYKAAFI